MMEYPSSAAKVPEGLVFCSKMSAFFLLVASLEILFKIIFKIIPESKCHIARSPVFSGIYECCSFRKRFNRKVRKYGNV